VFCGRRRRSSTPGFTGPTIIIFTRGPSQDDLRWWADRVREWQGMGRDVFVYFNNDGGGNAVRNAMTLKGMVGA